MKRTLFIGIAALTVACGGSQTRNSTTAEQAAQPSPGSSAPEGSAAGVPGSNELVTVTGCLKSGIEAGGAVGTSGSASPSSTGATTPGQNTGSTERFVLTNATAASTGSTGVPQGSSAGTSGTTGVGANGAGASGGPLVSGTSSYLLEGNPTELRSHLNHQVRITGRLANASMGTAGSTGAPAGSAPGSSGVNTGTTTAGAAQSTKQISVESVQMVAANCSQQ